MKGQLNLQLDLGLIEEIRRHAKQEGLYPAQLVAKCLKTSLRPPSAPQRAAPQQENDAIDELLSPKTRRYAVEMKPHQREHVKNLVEAVLDAVLWDVDLSATAGEWFITMSKEPPAAPQDDRVPPAAPQQVAEPRKSMESALGEALFGSQEDEKAPEPPPPAPPRQSTLAEIADAKQKLREMGWAEEEIDRVNLSRPEYIRAALAGWRVLKGGDEEEAPFEHSQGPEPPPRGLVLPDPDKIGVKYEIEPGMELLEGRDKQEYYRKKGFQMYEPGNWTPEVASIPNLEDRLNYIAWRLVEDTPYNRGMTDREMRGFIRDLAGGGPTYQQESLIINALLGQGFFKPVASEEGVYVKTRRG